MRRIDHPPVVLNASTSGLFVEDVHAGFQAVISTGGILRGSIVTSTASGLYSFSSRR